MEPRIQDGDLALVHKQDTLENGDLGVLVYGDEAKAPSSGISSGATASFCSPSTPLTTSWSSRVRT